MPVLLLLLLYLIIIATNAKIIFNYFREKYDSIKTVDSISVLWKCRGDRSGRLLLNPAPDVLIQYRHASVEQILYNANCFALL
jgi:predicted GNAT superfamily acetyltransferase